MERVASPRRAFVLGALLGVVSCADSGPEPSEGGPEPTSGTAPEIADIRGVNTSGVLATLIDRKLVRIVGRKQVVGRPFMYGTTRDFLDRFGLNDLSDLPKVEDMSELLGFELPGMDGAPEIATLPFDENSELKTQNSELRSEFDVLSSELTDDADRKKDVTH